jgi:hypothetical protein
MAHAISFHTKRMLLWEIPHVAQAPLTPVFLDGYDPKLAMHGDAGFDFPV